MSKEWREASAVLWRERNLKPAELPVTLVVWQIAAPQGPLPDCDAAATVAKAVLDGAVDAGVLPDDTSVSVTSVVLGAPVRCEPGELPGLAVALVSPVSVADLLK